jgi:hypothetical protein
MAQKKLWAAHATYDAVGEEQILEWRAQGHSVRKLCAMAGGTTRQLYHWLDKGKGHDVPGEWGATRRERWNTAGRIGAEAIVDGAVDSFERLRDPGTLRMRPDVTREEIALTKVETDFAKYRAGVQDPETYGEKKANAQISIGSLHLSAIKQVLGDRRGTEKALSAGEIPEAEVEEVLAEVADDDA